MPVLIGSNWFAMSSEFGIPKNEATIEAVQTHQDPPTVSIASFNATSNFEVLLSDVSISVVSSAGLMYRVELSDIMRS